MPYVGAILQSLFIFVGLSIYIGKVYFDAYLSTLGIPKSEVNLTVTDYAIVSPTTSLIAILVTLMASIFFLTLPSREGQGIKVNRIIVGLLLYLPGAALVVIATNAARMESAFSVVHFSLAIAAVFLIPFGGALVISGLPHGLIETKQVSEESSRSALHVDVTRLLAGLIVITSAFYVLISISSLTTKDAELDGFRTLKEAPRVHIEVSNSISGQAYRADDCYLEKDTCAFRVVLIGDHFIYLVADTPDLASIVDSGDVPAKYAIPIEEVSNIAYLPEINSKE